jgi:membrane protein
MVLPLTAVFSCGAAGPLSARRIDWQDLLPFGVIASSLTAAYAVGATVYVPHLFSSYATRYGVIGAVLAMISTLFCVMVVIVGSGGARTRGRRRARPYSPGERPPDDEVRSECDKVAGEVRARWAAARGRIDRRAGR